MKEKNSGGKISNSCGELGVEDSRENGRELTKIKGREVGWFKEVPLICQSNMEVEMPEGIWR